MHWKYYRKARSKKCPEWADPVKHKELRQDEIISRVTHRLFGTMTHSFSIYKEPFEKGSPCYCCGKPSVKRIWANTWGLASQYDVCQEHTFYHRKNCDEVERYEKKNI